MPLTAEMIRCLVDAQAAALRLPLSDDDRPGVIASFVLAAGLAERVESMPLGEDDRSGCVFTPVAPELDD